jgi:hypothetical protein
MEQRRYDRQNVRVVNRFGEDQFGILLEGINKGLTITQAAKATGFSRATVYDYLARNPEKQDVLKRQCKVSWLSKLEELAEASGDWRAYAWLLERNFPHEFALFTVQRHQINGSTKLEAKVHMVSEAELIEMHQVAAEVALQAPRFNTLKGQN